MLSHFWRKAVPYCIYGYMSLVGRTSSIRYEGPVETLDALHRPDYRCIYAFWHNRQVLFTFTHRDDNASVLVSRSRDGDLIAEAMRLSRIGAVRGSSSRAGAIATRELLETGARHRLGITPDGPKGPAGEIKDGVLFLALKTGLPILPLSNAVSHKLVFEKSWDRFQVPLPFSKACVIYGPPIWVRSQAEFQSKSAELRDTLHRITAEAERIVGNA